ncbi:MAG: TrmH family RNA methyltransferase, partial [Solirubrobacteraceae bacterium]
VRASMGAIFAVALARVDDLDKLPGKRCALVAGEGTPIQMLAAGGPLTLLVGAEREGLPSEVVKACQYTAHIPIASESLNAAMAATVALYETTRSSNHLTERGARPKQGDTSVRAGSPTRPTGLRPAAPPSRVPPS